MNMIKPTLSLLSLALISSGAIANEFKILDYHNGIKTNKLPCKMKVVKNWLANDQYMCVFNNSKTDIIEFQSDPISQEVYQIDRYILLNNVDALALSKMLFIKYGEPNDGFQNKSFRNPLPMMTWGESKIIKTSIYSAKITHPEKNGAGLSLQFLQCSGSSLGKCRNLFDITNNSPDLAVLNLTIFDADKHNYSATVIETGKAPKVEKIIKTETFKTQDITDFKF